MTLDRMALDCDLRPVHWSANLTSHKCLRRLYVYSHDDDDDNDEDFDGDAADDDGDD